MKKLRYISKTLFFSDKYFILKHLFNFTLAIFLGSVTSTLRIFSLDDYVIYPKFIEFIILTITYYGIISIITNIEFFKKFVILGFTVIASIILIFILMFVLIVLIFLMTYLFGVLGIASTWIYNQPGILHYRVRINDDNKHNDELKRLGLDDGTTVTCVGPVNFDTMLYASELRNHHLNLTDSFKYNYYKHVSLCFLRGFFSFGLLLMLSLILVALALIIPDIRKCLGSCKKEAMDLAEEIQVVDVKINS
jgi:hypothetical protein